MWIKVLLCSEDRVYVKKLIAYFEKKYMEKIEVNVLFNYADVDQYFRQSDVDVIIFGSEYENKLLEMEVRPKQPVMLLDEKLYEENNNWYTRVLKYQSADCLYKEILNIYTSGNYVKKIGVSLRDNESKLAVFASAAGGSGTTTIAKAYAAKSAEKESVLYLDMRQVNVVPYIEENSHGMDDVLRALKSRRNILPLKLESSVIEQKDKVYSFHPCKNPLDLMEITGEDVKHLIEGIWAIDKYQKIIVDIGTDLTAKDIELLIMADNIICVAQDNELAQIKLERYVNIMKYLEQKKNLNLLRKVMVFLNESGNHGQGMDICGLKVCGRVPKLSCDRYEELVQRIAYSDVFSSMELM